MASGSLTTVLEHIRTIAGMPAGGGAGDAMLLEAFAARHDPAAFAALVQRHGPMVLSVCRQVLRHAHDAEDAFQATFLVLVHKAGAIGRPERLANWLHGVAYRVAMRARAESGRRRIRERQGMLMQTARSLEDKARDHELGPVLHEEVNRLPAKYRGPIVLCYLEGKTKAEAAQHLGWPEGTVSGRLARARELLRTRLGRRGLAPSAGVFATLFAQGTASPAVPAALAESTVRMALLVAAGTAAAGTAGAPVTALTEGVLKAMSVARVKVVAALVLVAGLLAAGAGLAAHQTLAGKQAEARPKDEAKPPAKGADALKQDQGRQARTDRYGDPLPAGAFARLGTVRFRHEGEAWAMAFSRDSKLLASTSNGGRVFVWDAATGKELRRLQIPKPNGLIRPRVGPIDFSADGTVLAVASSDGIVLWDIRTGKQRRQFETSVADFREAYDGRIRFSPDGKTLAVAGSSFKRGLGGEVALVDAATGKELRHFGGINAAIYGLAFSPDGKLLADGTLNPSVRLWDPGNGKLVRELRDHGNNFVYAVAFSQDGKTLASGSWNKILLSEVATGKRLGTLEVKERLNGMNSGLAFTPDGRTLVAGYEDGKVRVWDVARKRLRFTLDGRMWMGRSTALSPDGKMVALGTVYNTIRLWDVATGKEQFSEFQGHDAEIHSVAYAPAGKILVTGDPNGRISFWDPASGKLRRQLNGTGAHVVTFSPDGKALATVWPYNKTIRLWDVATGRQRFKLETDGLEIESAAFLPDGKTLLAAHFRNVKDQPYQPSLHLWDAATGKHLRAIPVPAPDQDSLPRCLACAADGRTVALGTWSGVICLWDIQAGTEMVKLRGHQHDAYTVAFAPDGRTLASGSVDGTVRLWEVASGKEILMLRGHQHSVTAVVFSPDGRVVASGSADLGYVFQGNGPLKIRLWEVATGREILRLQGHDSNVTSLAFAPDGGSLASGLRNSTALVWDVRQANRGSSHPAQDLTAGDLDRFWAALADKDAPRTHAAVWALASAPEKAVALLKGRLRPAAGVGPERIRRLIADLDSDRFAVRDAASRKLDQVRTETEPALRQALAKKPSLEACSRLRALLAAPGLIRSSEVLRGVRAVQVLEQIGTPGARKLLKALSRGAPEARLTQEAKTSLGRLARRADAGR
ncbi:MAG TPA: sigma-70 family RNA polymerase sigma factor [Gemmataceae bacterium]|jgi:RNA polymerase sigma factor (sigma-70 family)|nr:sigma-70 family RNA polymerase sigma factor [Gemmataceae bacterium]